MIGRVPTYLEAPIKVLTERLGGIGQASNLPLLAWGHRAVHTASDYIGFGCGGSATGCSSSMFQKLINLHTPEAAMYTDRHIPGTQGRRKEKIAQLHFSKRSLCAGGCVYVCVEVRG